MSEGVRAREIADRLGLSEATVRNHIRVVLRRLDSHSQLEAVARAREWRLF
jgi:DNA-binding CsgD family transcriptional regulator